MYICMWLWTTTWYCTAYTSSWWWDTDFSSYVAKHHRENMSDDDDEVWPSASRCSCPSVQSPHPPPAPSLHPSPQPRDPHRAYAGSSSTASELPCRMTGVYLSPVEHPMWLDPPWGTCPHVHFLSDYGTSSLKCVPGKHLRRELSDAVSESVFILYWQWLVEKFDHEFPEASSCWGAADVHKVGRIQCTSCKWGPAHVDASPLELQHTQNALHSFSHRPWLGGVVMTDLVDMYHDTYRGILWKAWGTSWGQDWVMRAWITFSGLPSKRNTFISRYNSMKRNTLRNIVFFYEYL